MTNTSPLDSELYQKTVVITGASSGVGRAAAEAFAKEGAKLILVSRGEDALADVVAYCRSMGAPATGIPADMSVMGEVKDLFRKISEYTDVIDIFINKRNVSSCYL